MSCGEGKVRFSGINHRSANQKPMFGVFLTRLQFAASH